MAAEAKKEQLPERLREALKRQPYNTPPPETHDIERRMVDEILGGCGVADRSQQGGSIVTQMAARLRRVERAMQALRAEVAVKERRVFELEAENARLREGLVVRRGEELERLRQQVRDTEAFLGDYGLAWVGQQEVDVARFLASLRDLTARVGMCGSKQIARVGRVASFETRETEKITVYRDGFMLRAGPFRPFSGDSARAFVRDVLDGYFPAEFKSAYPDGVPFDVVDETGEAYTSGKALGPTPDAFLAKLPKSVVDKRGRILEVRDGVRKRLEKKENRRPRRDAATTQDPAPHNVAAIQVRDDDGKRMLLSMRVDDTVGDLRAEIDKNRLVTPGLFPSYEIRTAFPSRRVYDDPQVTLKDAGLAPTATVFLRLVV
ncbi:hypothetical protein CTAYLR_005121 [Chrysophaeum taylorii]|uniref:UBX domain-containing protein 11 n=1 Tax=Chrysophaeum taylorii TaxID=2483200 RepID=A0AAD7XKW4_9STRA|nr:hypothetical protein CTAYLR_005121 [Chrysophaeum taylorii]